jgi:hypothetical protein
VHPSALAGGSWRLLQPLESEIDGTGICFAAMVAWGVLSVLVVRCLGCLLGVLVSLTLVPMAVSGVVGMIGILLNIDGGIVRVARRA